MKKLLICLLITSIIAPVVAQNKIIPLWEADPPNYRETGEVTIWDTSDIVRVRNVQKPDIAVFLPFKKNATGEAVVICPGGGYGILPMTGKAVILRTGSTPRELLLLC